MINVLTGNLLLKLEKLGKNSKGNIEVQAKFTQLTKARPCALDVEEKPHFSTPSQALSEEYNDF